MKRLCKLSLTCNGRAKMKTIPLLILSAAALAVATDGAAQAITSTVQLTQQSIQNTKSASEGQSVHVNQHGLPQGSGGIECLADHGLGQIEDGTQVAGEGGPYVTEMRRDVEVGNRAPARRGPGQQ